MAIAREPSTPAAPTFDTTLQKRDQITVKWVTGTSIDIPVLGYRLYSDVGLNGDYYLIYDGSNNVN